MKNANKKLFFLRMINKRSRKTATEPFDVIIPLGNRQIAKEEEEALGLMQAIVSVDPYGKVPYQKGPLVYAPKLGWLLRPSKDFWPCEIELFPWSMKDILPPLFLSFSTKIRRKRRKTFSGFPRGMAAREIRKKN